VAENIVAASRATGTTIKALAARQGRTPGFGSRSGCLRPSSNTAIDRGRQTAWQDADGYVHTTLCDVAGNRTTTHYDRMRRPEAHEDALGWRTTTTDDPVGRPEQVIDPYGRITTTGYDALGRVTLTIDRHDGLRLSRAEGAGLVTYVWAGRDVLSEEGTSPQLFVRGHCLARAVGPGRDRTYLKQDGETVQALATSAGALETTYTADAWGSTLSGSAAGNPYVCHGGLGYAQDAGGLQYVRARWPGYPLGRRGGAVAQRGPGIRGAAVQLCATDAGAARRPERPQSRRP
jgi:YD repeat-containing protein